MEVIPISSEILDEVNESMTLNVEVPVAPRAVGGIPNYRGKVYRTLLNLEMDRFAIGFFKNDTLLFPKSQSFPQ